MRLGRACGLRVATMVAVILGLAQMAAAHTVAIAWRVEDNGDVTFYAASYHQPQIRGGINVDGTIYNFTDYVLYWPENVDGLEFYEGIPEVPITFWQTVTVSGLTSGAHLVSTTLSPIEYPWGPRIPIFLEIGPPPDTTPPTIACSVAQDSLWSPDGNFVNVGFDAVVTDDQDPAPKVEYYVFCDETDDDPAPDAANVDIGTLELRAERNGKGDGRVYLIVIVATDAAGNSATECCTVTVAHSKSKKSNGGADAQATGAEAVYMVDSCVPDGFVLIGAGGDI